MGFAGGSGGLDRVIGCSNHVIFIVFDVTIGLFGIVLAAATPTSFNSWAIDDFELKSEMWHFWGSVYALLTTVAQSPYMRL